MNHEEAVMAITVGVGSIIAALGKKGEFHALGPGQRPKPDTKSLPRWFGRLGFIGIGALCIYWGLPSLRGTWRWSDLWADWWFFALFAAVWLARTLVLRSGLLEPRSGVQVLDLSRHDDTNRNR